MSRLSLGNGSILNAISFRDYSVAEGLMQVPKFRHLVNPLQQYLQLQELRRKPGKNLPTDTYVDTHDNQVLKLLQSAQPD